MPGVPPEGTTVCLVRPIDNPYDANSVMTITRNAPYGNTNDVRAATINSASSYWGWTRCAATLDPIPIT